VRRDSLGCGNHVADAGAGRGRRHDKMIADMLIRTAAVPPFFKNGYLVVCDTTKAAVLIDPGDEVDALLDDAKEMQAKIGAILLTHAHLDHVTGVARARSVTSAPIWIHRDDLFLYEGVVEQGRMFGLRVSPQPTVDKFFGEGRCLEFGNYCVDVFHTPGHSPGGVCLAIGATQGDARQLFVGDTLFAGSIGRTDLPGGDMDTLLGSIRSVLFGFPDGTPVHSGHGPVTTIGEEKRTNPFL
jgi:glyoxylase-like metal-dependent hydrolase (beta-lactamase superfamily II)